MCQGPPTGRCQYGDSILWKVVLGCEASLETPETLLNFLPWPSEVTEPGHACPERLCLLCQGLRKRLSIAILICSPRPRMWGRNPKAPPSFCCLLTQGWEADL